MDDAEILSRVALFSLMKRRDLKRIAKLAKRIIFMKREIALSQRAIATAGLFVIISGQVSVVKDLGGTSEKTLRVLRSDNYFGEMALIDDYVRTASVVARRPHRSAFSRSVEHSGRDQKIPCDRH